MKLCFYCWIEKKKKCHIGETGTKNNRLKIYIMHKNNMKYLDTKCMAILVKRRYNDTHSSGKRKLLQNISGKVETE